MGEPFHSGLSRAEQERSVGGAAMGLGQSSKPPVTDDTDEGEFYYILYSYCASVFVVQT